MRPKYPAVFLNNSPRRLYKQESKYLQLVGPVPDIWQDSLPQGLSKKQTAERQAIDGGRAWTLRLPTNRNQPSSK